MGWPTLVAHGHYPSGTFNRADSPVDDLDKAADGISDPCGLAGIPCSVERGWEPMLLGSNDGQTAAHCPALPHPTTPNMCCTKGPNSDLVKLLRQTRASGSQSVSH